MERLYSEYPKLYDEIQSDWDYDRDCSFVRGLLDEPTACRLLEIGCGTGEHTRRFVDAGLDVTAIDPNEGMLARAREKTTAEFFATGIPGVPVDTQFDVIVAIRGVINHLEPDQLEPAVADMSAHLAPGGVLVFDNSPLPPAGNDPALDTGTAGGDRYARIVQMCPGDDRRLRWEQVVFTPDEKILVDSLPMTPFTDLEIAAALSAHPIEIDPVEGYGPEDDRTVFVGRRIDDPS